MITPVVKLICNGGHIEAHNYVIKYDKTSLIARKYIFHRNFQLE